MKAFTWVLIALTMIRIETRSCELDVCFNWTISSGMKLTLVCRIQKHQFATSIVDPKGDVKANCFPLHSWCFTNQNNGNVSFNHKTNELTLTVCGDINKGVNGDWLCKHGSDKAIAHVEATVLPYHDISNQSQVQTQQTLFGNQCIDVITCLALLSFLSSTIITLLILTFASRIQDIIHRLLVKTFMKIVACFCSQRDDKMRSIQGIKRGAFALSTLLFFGFAILVGSLDSADCETKWLFIPFGLVFGCIASLVCLSTEMPQELGDESPQRTFQDEENRNSLDENMPCLSATEDKSPATIDDEESSV